MACLYTEYTLFKYSNSWISQENRVSFILLTNSTIVELRVVPGVEAAFVIGYV